MLTSYQESLLYVRLSEAMEVHFPCQHGHYDCANYHRGPCLGEALSFCEGEEEGMASATKREKETAAT